MFPLSYLVAAMNDVASLARNSKENQGFQAFCKNIVKKLKNGGRLTQIVFLHGGIKRHFQTFATVFEGVDRDWRSVHSA